MAVGEHPINSFQTAVNKMAELHSLCQWRLLQELYSKNKNSQEPNKCFYELSRMSQVAEEKAKLVIADQSMKCIKVVREWGRVEDSAVGQ